MSQGHGGARGAVLGTDDRAGARSGQRLLIAAHGNSLRALVKYLDGVGDQEIVDLNIPTGIPLVYELDANLKPTNRFYLGDPATVAAAQAAVAAQGKART